MIRTYLSLIAVLPVLFGASITPHVARAADLPKPEYVQINLYSSVSTVAPGQPFTLIIEQVIKPEWHTYWKNPGDSGTPTAAKFDMPQGGTAGKLEFPTPQRIPYGPLMNFGFSGRALFSAEITPPPAIESETYTINANLEWLVCKDICLPEADRYSLILPVAATPTVNDNDGAVMRDLTLTHPIRVEWPAKFHEENGNFLLTFTPAGQAADLIDSGAKVEFFPEEWGLFKYPDEQVIAGTDDGSNDVMLIVPRDMRDIAEVPNLRGVVAITDNSGNRMGFDILAAGPNAAAASQTASAESAGTTTASAPAPQPANSNSGLIQALIFGLIGGLILNLMPCVFPVLSLKVLSLAQHGATNPHHLRAHGLAYAAGVILTFLAVAGILIALQTAGSAIGWGFQLQQPLMVTLLVYLFTLIGLNLMGWFEVDINRLIPARLHKERDGLAGSFATGILATIVATPCTAPFMATALAYALTHNPAVGLAVFAMMGIGLSLPFVLICYLPVLQHLLPRPGAWMLTLRQLLAFPMFIAAIWLLWVLGHQTGSDGIAIAMLGAISIALVIWLLHHQPTGRTTKALRWALIGLSLLALLMTTCAQNRLLPTAGTATSENSNGAIAFTPQTLDQALKGDSPVFVNMTAAWCITCKYNERTAIATQTTKDVFTAHHVTYIKGDWTNYNADITNYLSSFDRKGVPLYVFYGAPDQTTGKRPDPVVLPQLLTEKLMRETISRAAP